METKHTADRLERDGLNGHAIGYWTPVGDGTLKQWHEVVSVPTLLLDLKGTVLFDEANAYADLFSAAPDLAEALKDCLTSEGAIGYRDGNKAARIRFDAINATIRAALAKAGL